MAENEMLILWDSVGRNAVYGEKPEYFEDYDEEEGDEVDFEKLKETYANFREQYELLGYKFLGDPKEDFYQGHKYTTVYKRISDGALFGFTYWQGGGKYGEAWIEPNGDDFGIGWDDPRGSAYVFLPVEPFTITGYKTVDPR